MALKKDIEAILTKLGNQESVLLSLCWEFVLALASILIDHLFDKDQAPGWIWIVIIVVAVLPPLIIICIKFFKWSHKVRAVRNGHLNVKQDIDLFDNEITYWVMLSNSYKNILTDDTPETDAEKAFLFCEASYYNNKSMEALYFMKSIFSKVFSDNLDVVKTDGLIDLSRLVVILEMIKSQQADLDEEVESISTREEVKRQKELNERYLSNLKEFLLDVKAQFKDSFPFEWN